MTCGSHPQFGHAPPHRCRARKLRIFAARMLRLLPDAWHGDAITDRFQPSVSGVLSIGVQSEPLRHAAQCACDQTVPGASVKLTPRDTLYEHLTLAGRQYASLSGHFVIFRENLLSMTRPGFPLKGVSIRDEGDHAVM